MKGVKKALREGYYAALSGVISVPVDDGRGKVTQDKFVVIGDVIEGSNSNSFDRFRTDATIVLMICDRQTGGFTHDAVDDIEDEILQIVIPGVDTGGVTVAGFQVTNVVKEGSGYSDEFGYPENMAKIILRIRQTLVQQ